jgi:hypothetical protein
MPAPIILRNLVPETKKVDNPPSGQPKIATRSDLRDGTRSGGGTVPSPGQQVISGSGFGSGPQVVLFASMDGVEGELVGLSDPEVGAWTSAQVKASGAVAGARYYSHNGKTWMAARDINNLSSSSKLMTGMRLVLGTPVSTFRLAYKVAIPAGYKAPGAAANGGSPSDSGNSVWKMTWFDDQGGYGTVNKSDVCIPTWAGAGAPQVGGNTTRPQFYDDGYSRSVFMGGTQYAGEENLLSFFHGPAESSDGARDSVLSELVHVSSGALEMTRYTQCDPYHTDDAGDIAPADRQYSDLCVPGWFGNTPYSGVLPLYRDIYLSPDEQCLILSDASSLALSTEMVIIPPDSWTDTEITYTPRSYDPGFRHLYLSDGTVLENV